MMIAAATQVKHSMSLDNLPFGWFDVAVILVLAFGLFRGRKNGMTKEILPMLQWITIVIVCGLGYQMVGQVIINISGWSKLLSYIMGYLVLAFVVHLGFILIKKIFMPRLTGSNFFGSNEYYLGMVSGMIRYACILIFALALLNAPFYTAADIRSHQAYVARWFGGGEKGYSGDFFPTLQTVQEGVFKNSVLGPFIKNCPGGLLIDSAPAETDRQKSSAPEKPKPIIHIGN